jgi:hypothetical protein
MPFLLFSLQLLIAVVDKSFVIRTSEKEHWKKIGFILRWSLAMIAGQINTVALTNYSQLQDILPP